VVEHSEGKVKRLVKTNPLLSGAVFILAAIADLAADNSQVGMDLLSV
jgi:hypothetical protein